MKRIDGLFEKIISDENLDTAIYEVNKSHRWLSNHRPNKTVAWVEETATERREELRRIIVEGFQQSKPKTSVRFDKNSNKWRTINEPVLYPDQYVHHALIQVLKPIFMRGMDSYCCGSVDGKGTHYGAKAISKWMTSDRKGTKYCFTMDIRHFYDTLKPSVVIDRMRQLIKDARTLDLIERTLVDGVLIGSYTSQWYANTTLQPLDRLFRIRGIHHYVRYIDNFTVFCSRSRTLRKIKAEAEKWLNKRGLEIKSDWQVFRTALRLPNALGYRYGVGYTLIRKKNLLNIKRQTRDLYNKIRKKKRISYNFAAGLLSRLAQLSHCSNARIYKKLFRGRRLIRFLKRIVSNYAKSQKYLTWEEYMNERKRYEQKWKHNMTLVHAEA